jgi:hypothetical protein
MAERAVVDWPCDGAILSALSRTVARPSARKPTVALLFFPCDGGCSARATHGGDCGRRAAPFLSSFILIL